MASPIMNERKTDTSGTSEAENGLRRKKIIEEAMKEAEMNRLMAAHKKQMNMENAKREAFMLEDRAAAERMEFAQKKSMEEREKMNHEYHKMIKMKEEASLMIRKGSVCRLVEANKNHLDDLIKAHSRYHLQQDNTKNELKHILTMNDEMFRKNSLSRECAQKLPVKEKEFPVPPTTSDDSFQAHMCDVMYPSRFVREERALNFDEQIEKLTRQNNEYEAEIRKLKDEMATLPSEDSQSSSVFQSEFFNRFNALRFLGGSVIEAEEIEDHSYLNLAGNRRKFAVKRIALGVSAKSDQAFRESRALAQLDHPGIVRYYHTWMEMPPAGRQRIADEEMSRKLHCSIETNYADNSKFLYIQMQLCQQSLENWLREHQSLASRDLQRMKWWFKQIVNSVQYIHAKNLIHRDLKPSNILFADSDRLKICDMGVASLPSADDEADISGTTSYKSPEQLFYTAYSSKVDVFALGLIFAELCVVLSPDHRSKIFDDYRCGKSSGLVVDKETDEFISMLTQPDPAIRSTCREILDSSYLSDT